ncbi:MAG: FtsX-like permease family protein [Gammaproteobacteria bacterium]|nr:FtsX-like permease family protein [Gammaproteobacteria bacterium]
MLSEPLARSLGVPLDPDPAKASVRIRTGEGERRVPVTGVFREYGGGRGTLVLPREFWPSPPPGVHILELHGVADPTALAARLLPLLPPGAELRRNDEILARSLEVFDRTFRVTGVLQTLAGLVAAIGLFGALSALALERRALFGVLRALGVPRSMPALQSLVESLLIAALAGLLAMPLGVVVAGVLVEVVNVRAFGWSMDLALSPVLLLQALLVALAAGGLAALGPALELWRTSPLVMLGDTRALG